MAGHASGRVVLWDVMTGVVLKEVTDLHTEAVSHLRFLHPARPHAISADATGATHLIQFHRILMSHTVSRQVRCLERAGGRGSGAATVRPWVDSPPHRVSTAHGCCSACSTARRAP